MSPSSPLLAGPDYCSPHCWRHQTNRAQTKLSLTALGRHSSLVEQQPDYSSQLTSQPASQAGRLLNSSFQAGKGGKWNKKQTFNQPFKVDLIFGKFYNLAAKTAAAMSSNMIFLKLKTSINNLVFQFFLGKKPFQFCGILYEMLINPTSGAI